MLAKAICGDLWGGKDRWLSSSAAKSSYCIQQYEIMRPKATHEEVIGVGRDGGQ
jgi:hypothetical protein